MGTILELMDDYLEAQADIVRYETFEKLTEQLIQTRLMIQFLMYVGSIDSISDCRDELRAIRGMLESAKDKKRFDVGRLQVNAGSVRDCVLLRFQGEIDRIRNIGNIQSILKSKELGVLLKDISDSIKDINGAIENADVDHPDSIHNQLTLIKERCEIIIKSQNEFKNVLCKAFGTEINESTIVLIALRKPISLRELDEDELIALRRSSLGKFLAIISSQYEQGD